MGEASRAASQACGCSGLPSCRLEGPGLLLEAPKCLLNLLCGNHSLVSGAGNNELSHTGQSQCRSRIKIFIWPSFQRGLILLFQKLCGGRRSLLRGTDFRLLFPVDLLGLLKWRSNTNLLQQNLRQLMKVDGGEVVKVTRPPQGSGSFVVLNVCEQL